MNARIQIAIASDQRYFNGLFGTLLSVVLGSQSKMIDFHIIDGGISSNSWSILEKSLSYFEGISLNKVEIDQNHFEGFPAFYFESKMAYARILLPSLLNLDKVIYIDSDILFLKNIDELWHLSMENQLALVVQESITPKLKDDFDESFLVGLGMNPMAPYFNSGVMCINLDLFRDQQIKEKTLAFIKAHPDQCRFWDQSALNITLYDKTKFIDQSWNTQSHREVFKIEDRVSDFNNRSINYHFVTSNKPWLYYNEQLPYRMFVALLEQFDIDLNKLESFFQSRESFRKTQRGAYFKSKYYLIKGFFNSSNKDKYRKLSQYWLTVSVIENFHKTDSITINNIYSNWEEQIDETFRN